MDELQLQLLQNAEAAVPPMNSRKPDTRLDPRAATPPPSSGKDNRAPMLQDPLMRESVCVYDLLSIQYVVTRITRDNQYESDMQSE